MASTIAVTVPFLSSASKQVALRMGDDVFVPHPRKVKQLEAMLSAHLTLGPRGAAISARDATAFVTGQYDSCLEHIFSSTTWSGFRDGKGQAALIAYLIETRHYLHAATSRMSGGVSALPHERGINAHLAEHLIEEADHARFFEDALALLGIPQSVVRQLRPDPATMEWILVMRAAGFDDPLAAAISSGLMEFSAQDRSVVTGWHEMLVGSGLLPEDVVSAMRRHIDLDAELGHGSNWKDCIESYRRVEPHRLANALNLSTVAAEATRNWSDALSRSSIGTVVFSLGQSRASVAAADPIFSADRVWSAPFLSSLVGAENEGMYAAALAAAYSLSAPFPGLAPELRAQAMALRDKCSVAVTLRSGESLNSLLDSWLCSIDGHRLWTELTDSGNETLATGWIAENYHYLAASPRHVSSGIFACPDADIRQMLTAHLAEETGHEEILASSLVRLGHQHPKGLRPLPSTVAFIGYLRELGLTDWKAYVIALSYLQRSLVPGDSRHSAFYEKMRRSSKMVASLANAMHRHDEVDTSLNHGDQIGRTVSLLQERHEVSRDSIQRAALVPYLAWRFLEGIAEHYVRGRYSLTQRAGWQCA